ncbi:MAG TPA: hypothetical protein VMS89_01595 [Methanoregulaceae archaeon]|nr:hypothetical protein [Methanoregulaceae archaeon]
MNRANLALRMNHFGYGPYSDRVTVVADRGPRSYVNQQKKDYSFARGGNTSKAGLNKPEFINFKDIDRPV